MVVKNDLVKNNEFYVDEVITARKAISAYQKKRNSIAAKQKRQMPRKFDNYVFISDGTTIEDILIPAYCGYASKATYFVDAFPETEFNAPFCSENEAPAIILSEEELSDMDFLNTAFVLLIDSKKRNGKWFDLLKTVSAATQKNDSGNYIITAVLVPALRKIPGSSTAVAEREYDFILETGKEEKTPEEAFLLELEKELRRIVKTETSNLSLLRFDNLFGSLGSNFASFDIDKIIKDAFEQKEVLVTKEDRRICCSCMYTRDAALAVAAATSNAKPGHEYDVSEYSVSVAKVKNTIEQLCHEDVALKTDGLTYSKDEFEYHNFTSLKFNNIHFGLTKHYTGFSDAFNYMLCSRFGRQFDVVSKLSIYRGNLGRLKEAEIDILREIDRICRKHDIKYFLAGGSCLGAIRGNCSIPWDDDLDIGMLRKDFEVFRRVAPQEINNEKFIYSSPQTDENCHYFFDKVRLRDTYFSTLYSGKFAFDDGVFVDIVVYDKTTSNKLMQKIHVRLITLLRYAIYLRWHDYIVPKRRRWAKAALPFLRLIPFSVLHKWYDKLTMRYENKKNTKYLIDGGAHIYYGGFDKNMLDCDVEYVSFDGMENAPIPVNYPSYLSYLYGENYRAEPKLSSRLGAHKLARIDLGKYLVDNDPEEKFRSVDIRGELFEDEEMK